MRTTAVEQLDEELQSCKESFKEDLKNEEPWKTEGWLKYFWTKVPKIWYSAVNSRIPRSYLKKHAVQRLKAFAERDGVQSCSFRIRHCLPTRLLVLNLWRRKLWCEVPSIRKGLLQPSACT